MSFKKIQGGEIMSKGNGRNTKKGMGNGFDNFKGTSNGVSSSIEDRLNDLNSYPRKPNSLDNKAGNFKYTNPSNKDIKEFKNKIK